jgi:hypothetical protein
MAVKFVELDKVNLAFSKVAKKKEITDESVRKSIADLGISILKQEKMAGKKGQEKKVPITKVLKKTGDGTWYLRLFYGVATVTGAEISATDEQEAIQDAIKYCEDISAGKCDSKVKAQIKKAHEDKAKALQEAKETRALHKKKA